MRILGLGSLKSCGICLQAIESLGPNCIVFDELKPRVSEGKVADIAKDFVSRNQESYKLRMATK